MIPALNQENKITTTNRFTILKELATELIVPITLVILALFTCWRTKNISQVLKNKKFLFFALIGLISSLPLIISFKQRSIYLAPSIPYYSLAFSFLFVSYFKKITDRIPEGSLKIIKNTCFITIGIVLIYSIIHFGEISRDEEKIKDIHILTNYVPEGTVFSSTKSLTADWVFIAYMSRIGFFSIIDDYKNDYFISEKPSHAPLPKNFTPVPIPLKNHLLYKKRTIPY